MQKRYSVRIYLLHSLVLILACLCAIGPMFDFHFPSVDLGERLYHVQEVLDGRVPYRDFFIHHFTGYLIPFSIYFSVFPVSGTSIWILCLLFHAVTSAGIVATVLFMTRSYFTAWIAALAAVTAGWCWNWGGHTFNNQSYFLPLLSWWIYCVCRACQSRSRDWWYAAALLQGFLILFDIRLLLFVPVSLIVYLISGRKEFGLPVYSGLFLCILMGSLPALAALLFLLQFSAFDSFIFQTYIYPVYFKSAGMESAHTQAMFILLSWIPRGQPFLTISAYFGLLGMLRHNSTPIRWFFLLTVVACCGYAIAAGRDRPNYLLVLMPPFLILSVCGIWQLKKLSKFLAIIAAVPLALSIVSHVSRPIQVWNSTLSFFIPADERAIHTAADLVKKHSDSEDSILVVGHGASIYILSERLSDFKDASLVSVAGADFHSYNTSPSIVPEMAASFRTFLEHNPPEVIVYYYSTGHPCPESSIYCRYKFPDSSKTYPMLNMDFRKAAALTFLESTLQEDYISVVKREWDRDGIEVYRKKHEPQIQEK